MVFLTWTVWACQTALSQQTLGGGAGCGKVAGWLGCTGGADLRGNRLRVDMAVATLGETPSLTQDRKWARDEQASCIVPSLAPPQQAVQQGGLPCPGEYLRPCPFTTEQGPRTKK